MRPSHHDVPARFLELLLLRPTSKVGGQEVFVGPVMGAGHEENGGATDDGQDDGDDDQNGLDHLGAAAPLRRVLGEQSLDPTASSVITGHAYAHGLLQPLDVFAVAVNAVAEVGGGAGVLGGAGRGRGRPGGDAGVSRVQGGRALAPVSVLPLAFAFPLLLLITDGAERVDAEDLVVSPRKLFVQFRLVIVAH